MIRYENRAKRDARITDNHEITIDQVIGSEPTPDFTHAIMSEFKDLSDKLVDDEMLIIIVKKMEGYSNTEISQSLNCSVRTVRRRLEIIRSLLIDELDEQDK